MFNAFVNYAIFYSMKEVLELAQYILDCGWDFNRNSMGDTGMLVSEVVFLGLGLVRELAP